jgi:DNA (cytosine-5)-methyltransferase 1
LTIGSLFSGIGGLELGLEMCGLGPVVWQAECDPYARAVLEKHWPGVKRYEDVREIDERAERPDVICGGFPCQDISSAGHAVGIEGARSGLWAEIVRLVRLLQPRYVFVENVAALLDRGVGRVLGDLAEAGHDAEWGVFGADEAGAPQRRDRFFLLAYPAGLGCHALPVSAGVTAASVRPWGPVFAADMHGRIRRIPDPAICRVVDGTPGELDRYRCLGNAVVPQQAALAWRTLIERAAA